MLFSQLEKIADGRITQLATNRSVDRFLTDSRKVTLSDTACFFAIRGPRHDGHQFIGALYQSGIRQFVVEADVDYSLFPEANFFLTPSSLGTLQQLAFHHRQQFNYPVVGITGSNGKTIIKEWLFQLLAPDLHIVKNPGSYNSQLGVPLAVLQMQPHHQLGIFEAGISKVGEMIKLASLIQPSIGIFTNIGTAHDGGFATRQQKIEEKLKLFSKASLLIYCQDYADLHAAVVKTNVRRLSWGRKAGSDIPVEIAGNQLQISFQGIGRIFVLPVTDVASVENLIHCIILLLHLGKSIELIQARITHLKTVPMRLEMKQGIHQSQIIDDSYNNDLAGLQISVNFLGAQQKKKKTIILSDILQSGLAEKDLIKSIVAVLTNSGIQKMIGVGPILSGHSPEFDFIPERYFYSSTADLLTSYSFEQFQNEVVLLKGARSFEFEKIAQRLQKKIHGTVMEVDLNAMVHNLNYFKSLLKPGVKVMVMIKAFAYGSGSEEVANLLQYHKVDYLGVAYADEGIDLRKNQISLPIMVMNPSEESFSTLLDFQLEPEIYSLKILRSFINFLQGRSCRIHIKLDTGMHRLGFEEADIDEMAKLLKENRNLEVVSAFTHLAATDESTHDVFSRQQVATYQRMYAKIEAIPHKRPLRHVLNSPGILRFSEFQFDMVRLGIGLYGINPTEKKVDELKPVATLKTMISQIKKIPIGETIGYGRRGLAEETMTLATIAIGYADGFSRNFSRGVGKVLVHGKKAPVVGNVCMDMTMIDITGIEAKEGDEVIIFGKDLPIYEVAESIQTIPYEILTNTSDRVKRVFFSEGI